MRTVVSGAGVVLLVSMYSPLVAQVPSFDPGDGHASFGAMAEYLALAGRVLELRIVVHYADSTGVSSEGQWTWHPGESRLTYRMVGRNGSRTEGTTDFTPPSTFTTVATAYARRGNATVHRDDNVLVDASLHRNETFRQNADGSWTSQGVYEWRREPGPQSATHGLRPTARSTRERSWS